MRCAVSSVSLQQLAGVMWVFAQGGGVDIVYLLKVIVIVAAVVAIVYVALTYFGVGIPPAAVKIFWIVVIAALALIGITFLMRLV
jgi:hypothetical protein